MSRRIRTARRLQLRVGRLLLVVVVLLLGNSLFLYLERLPDGIVAPMVRLHVWFGVALSVLLPAFFVPHLLTHRSHANRRAKWIGFLLLAAITVGCCVGLVLAWQSRGAEHRWLLRVHEIAFGLALAGYMVHRLAARKTPVLRYELVGLTASLAILGTLWAAQMHGTRSAGSDGEVPPEALPTSFGASRALTTAGHYLGENDLGNPEYCAQCHVEIAAQWEGSMHRFSSQNDPFYERTLAVMMRDGRPEAFQFCGGCHDPLVLLTGNMNDPIGPDSVNAQEGITCLACHAIVAVRDRIGNAGYVIEPPEHYPFYGSSDPDEREMNRRLIRTKPEKHKESFLKPLHRTAEFCLTCHKAHLDAQVNGYRWKRGPNDFDAWHDSAAGLQSALTFYNGEEVRRCQDCHMPDVPTDDPAARDGLTRDHGFPAANTAVAMLEGKADQRRRTEEILRDSVSVDIFAATLSRGPGDSERLFPIEAPGTVVPAGETVRVEVVLRNREVGHAFPSGTTDLNEPWLQFEVADANGRMLVASGRLDATGRLDPSAHKLVSVLLTREGRLVDIHNVEEFYATVYANLIPLGQSDVVRYEFAVPERAVGSKLRLTARLNYRKFSRQYTEFALGVDAPRLPVTVIGEDTVELTIGSSARRGRAEVGKELAYRLNDFGIAHLRQGDTRTAVWAFERVVEAMPDYADGWINLARCHLLDGAYDLVEDVLRRADAVKPGYPKTGYFLGRLRAAQGRFDEAVNAYNVALASFPNDREVLNAKGTALYKLERFQDAVAVFTDTLLVDPENLTAHTLLFRSYASMGDEENAAAHEVAYLRYRTEQREKVATERYRRNNANADVEANPQHVHALTPPSPWFDHPNEYRPHVARQSPAPAPRSDAPAGAADGVAPVVVSDHTRPRSERP